MYMGVVITPQTITWDSGQQLLPAGTILGLTAGGALETAIGTSNIQVLSAVQAISPGGAAGGISN